MRKGFTLIELTFVLMIVGLIIGMGLDFAGPMLEKSKRDEDRAKMRMIEDALLTYLKTHGKYPCPARRDLATTNSGFGASTDCSAVAPTGTTDVSPEGIRIGVVPVRELNLPPTYMFDSYKNRITYAAIKGLAQTNTLYDSYTTAGVAPDTDGVGGGDTDGIITVVDANGTQITNVHNKIIVPYVLVSHGKDGLGSYKKTGAANAACDASHKDGANCDNNNIFRDVEYLDVAGSNYFDDVIRWKTKDHMEIQSGKLSITTGTGGGLPSCVEGQILKYTSGAWACAKDSGYWEGTLLAGPYSNDGYSTSLNTTYTHNISSYTTQAKYITFQVLCWASLGTSWITMEFVDSGGNRLVSAGNGGGAMISCYVADSGGGGEEANAYVYPIPANTHSIKVTRYTVNTSNGYVGYWLKVWK
jgi:prepilin-type N-terminal cleavage/methylation domain-containing protein